MMPNWFSVKKIKHIEDVRYMDSMIPARNMARENSDICTHRVKDSNGVGQKWEICADCGQGIYRGKIS